MIINRLNDLNIWLQRLKLVAARSQYQTEQMCVYDRDVYYPALMALREADINEEHPIRGGQVKTNKDE